MGFTGNFSGNNMSNLGLGVTPMKTIGKIATSMPMQANVPLNVPYDCDPVKWYQVQPYGFDFTGKSQRLVMWLPISPNNLNITTHFATNIVTTLYGVIEEHSEIRYYDIVISGTTGYAPRHVAPGTAADYIINDEASRKSTEAMGQYRPISRSAFTNSPLIPNLGVGQQTISAINQAVDQINSLRGVNNPNTTGIHIANSGYVAFHNLYRLFHVYKRDTAGTDNSIAAVTPRKVHPLRFLNYKDGNKYDCVPRSFTLTRSAESPMLYNYQIVLRAYNLRSIYATDGAPDRANKLADLGLGDVKGSLFSKFKNITGSVKGIVGGLKSGLSAFGR